MHSKSRHRSPARLACATRAVLAAVFATPALSATTQWQTTGAGGNQDWSTAANWTAGVPSSSDTALFTTFAPPSNTVTIGSNIGVGAITDLLTSNLSLTGTSTVTLSGQTFNYTSVDGAVSQANTILANVSSGTTNKSLTLASGLSLALNGTASNYILTNRGPSTSNGSTITINGNISNGAAPSALTYFGGGNGNNNGGLLNLSGLNNTFSGGITVGNTAGTQGGTLNVTANNLESGVTYNSGGLGTGSVTVNEQSQLLLSGSGAAGSTYKFGTPGQLLTINGIGINKTSSGAIRTAGSAGDTFIWQGDLFIGTAADANANGNFVIISVTSAANKTLNIAGKFTGGGKLQKQGQGTLLFSGTNNDNTSPTQIGNGVITVAAGSKMGTGDLDLFQTSSNTATVNLLNVNQPIGSLSSHFTATTGGSATTSTQYLNIGNIANLADTAHTLTITQTADTSFGYGAVSTLTSTIGGGGNVVMSAASTGTLTLTGPNTYVSGTILNGGTLSVANGSTGSATGPGDVTINAGGKLASGNAIVFNAPVTTGKITGNVIVNSGGQILPGGPNKAGSITLGGLTANNGSIFNFDLIGGSTAVADSLTTTNAATLAVGGTQTLNLVGSKLAFGTYTLMTFGSGLTNAGTQFVLGSTPGGIAPSGATSFIGNNNRTYNLVTDNLGVTLTIINTASERLWSLSGNSPATDGAGTWNAGSTTFFNTNPNLANAPYDNASNNDVLIGNGGAGGVITLGGNMRVGGNLIFGSVTSPYSIGAVGGTNTLTLAKGIATSADAIINAPVILEASQTLSVGTGTTTTFNANISEVAGSAKTLTKDDVGTLILNGSGTWTGGTVISAGVLRSTTAGLPATAGITNNASLVFAQAASGSYSGNISGSGTLTIANTSPTAVIALSGTNTYSGATILQSGVLSVSAPGILGSGAGGIILSGGTLKATANLSFPLGSPTRAVTLTAETTSTVDTGGFNVVFGQNIGGSGNLTKTGLGDLTLTGLPSTTVIGQVAVAQGSLTLAPPANIPSFGISASTTPGTFAGDLVVATPMELRLVGGDFSGGGSIRIKPAALVVVSRGTTTISNNIVLNDNTSPIPGFSVNLGANALNSLTITGVISGQADVNITGGAGVTSLGGANTYTGATLIDNGAGGEVQLLANNTLPVGTAVRVSSTGILNTNGKNQTIASLESSSANAVVLNEAATPSTLTINGSASTTFAGSLADGQLSTLALTLAAGNTGSLKLSGFNLISGPINIVAGRLDISSKKSLGGPGTITVGATSGNSQLRFNGIVDPFEFGSTLVLTAPPPSITIAGLGGYGTDPGAIRVENAATVLLPSPINFAANGGIAVSGGSTLELSGTLSGTGALVKQGPGPLTLSGTNTGYTGGTQVTQGTLTVNDGSALGTGPLDVSNGNSTLAGSAVVLNLNNSSQSVGSLSGSVETPTSGTNTATINLGASHILTVNQTTAGTYAGSIAGATGSIVKNGPAVLTLSGVNTYGGTTTVGSGTLLATSPASLPGYDTAGKVSVSAGATLAVRVGGAGDFTSLNVDTVQSSASFVTGSSLGFDVQTGNSFTYASNVSGTKGLAKSGPGTLNLTGIKTYTGGTTVTGGILDATGGSIVASSGPATVTGAGSQLKAAKIAPSSLSVGAGAKVTLTNVDTVGNATGRSSVGTWDNSGLVDLGKTGIVIGTASEATILAQILSARGTGPTGTWTGVTGITSSNAAANAGNRGIGYVVTGASITVAQTILGDANLDDVVNIDDLSVLAQNYNLASKNWQRGDFNYDGTVNIDDLSILAQNYNLTSSDTEATPDTAAFAADLIPAFGAPSVPEPTSVSLMALAGAGLLSRRRWRA